MFSLLEGDGVIENIFHLLWTKDSIFGRESYVIIPDTIIFKYQKPCYWYFTSKVDNKIKKKSTSKLTNELIKEKFLQNVSKSGIIAYFLYKKTGTHNKYNTHPIFEIPADREDLNSNYTIEYFDSKNFDQFFDNIPAYSDGILQKFEDPKGDFNFTLRLVWSPKICIFEKRTNLKNLYDKKFSIYEKVVTYDGEEFQSRNESIMGNNLPDRLEKIGNSIATHISNVTLERIKIARMVLNFKITNNDTIILLWCSSLRLENTIDKKYTSMNNTKFIEKYKECEVNKIKINLSDNVNMFKFSFNGKPIKPLKDSVCTSCYQKTESYKLSQISFKYIIESHDNKKREKKNKQVNENIMTTSSGVEIIPYLETKPQNHTATITERIESKRQNNKNYLIPPIINYLYPKMKYEEYSQMKTENVFTSKTAFVCEDCFLEITKFCNIVGSNTLGLVRQMKPFKGTVYKNNKNTEMKVFWKKIHSLEKQPNKEKSKFLKKFILNSDMKRENSRQHNNLTNQMFCSQPKFNLLPSIISKERAKDSSPALLTQTNNDTKETDYYSNLDSYKTTR